jgi:outer membrane translocation and assembly module TamA
VRGSLESERPLGSLLTGGLSIAGFVDVARAWGRLGGLDPSRLYVDAGVGVRVRGPGGVVRLDVARGLRGGGTVFSASWGGAWPR